MSYGFILNDFLDKVSEYSLYYYKAYSTHPYISRNSSMCKPFFHEKNHFIFMLWIHVTYDIQKSLMKL